MSALLSFPAVFRPSVPLPFDPAARPPQAIAPAPDGPRVPPPAGAGAGTPEALEPHWLTAIDAATD
jgi:hypothetical protein